MPNPKPARTHSTSAWNGCSVGCLPVSEKPSPGARSVIQCRRLPLGVALVAGGTVGFLPIVGFWMLPVGLVMIARDVPSLRPPLVRFFDWFEAEIARSEAG